MCLSQVGYPLPKQMFGSTGTVRSCGGGTIIKSNWNIGLRAEVWGLPGTRFTRHGRDLLGVAVNSGNRRLRVAGRCWHPRCCIQVHSSPSAVAIFFLGAIRTAAFDDRGYSTSCPTIVFLPRGQALQLSSYPISTIVLSLISVPKYDEILYSILIGGSLFNWAATQYQPLFITYLRTEIWWNFVLNINRGQPLQLSSYPVSTIVYHLSPYRSMMKFCTVFNMNAQNVIIFRDLVVFDTHCVRCESSWPNPPI